ncbi:hypothetical protein FWH13_01990 [Candidatus Saccharibacteria bacterium]|nr:hypothetical protein [Candidatus Saccharibacteria bacterium]
MADFLDSRRGHSPLSDFLHLTMNVGFAIAVVVLAMATGAFWPSLLLVIVSKWRVFLVRPRFWWVSIEANLVDLMVGVSVAYLAFFAGDNFLLSATMLVFYAVWLTTIKPRSSSLAHATQAGVMLLLTSTALMTFGYSYEPLFVIGGAFAVAYAAANHYLSSTDEHATYLSLVFGLLNAELWWILYHWNIYYVVPWLNLMVPQAALLTLLLGFVGKTLVDYKAHPDKSKLVAPAVFSSILLLTILISFSDAIRY